MYGNCCDVMTCNPQASECNQNITDRFLAKINTNIA